ncbi:alkaline phosphatase family protein [uncultured Friedmanniella sp.]|uniref:alkaline phosphatase family protein n=1 Tax=uncultured Friedmanniella sp. TaxID=335381 RepID=UPI0035CC2A2E
MIFANSARPLPTRRLVLRRLGVGLGLLALVSGAVGTATAGAGAAGPVAAATTVAVSGVPRPAHTVVVMLENKNRHSVIGSSKAPYLNALAKRGANMSQSYGVTHPSQGNYVALFSGSQHGVVDDSCPARLGATDNLASQLSAAGLTFTGYSESLPKAGYTGCKSGNYRRKHSPWVNFSTTTAKQSKPMSAFPSDYDKLPAVSIVTPNMCHDMHDCSVATGDAWVKKNLDGYARWAKKHNSLLVVTFDENAGGTVNQIPTLLVGQQVRPGTYAEWMNHYTLLRTIEDAYGLAPLGHATSATPLRTIWTTSPRATTGVSNGSFEPGLTRWAVSGKTSTSRRLHHHGKRSAVAGSTAATTGDSIISQTVTVPSGRHTLSLWWAGRCTDTKAKAWATVVVRRNSSGKTSTPLPRTCAKRGSWKKVTMKVTPGHSYTISMVTHDDGVAATPNRTYFDYVRLT